MTNLFVISAPSGTGKTSLIKRALIDLIEQKIKLSTSYTTRKRRPEEKNGESYYFVTKEQFEYMIAKGDFIEHAEVFGNLYGTNRKWVEEQIKSEFDIRTVLAPLKSIPKFSITVPWPILISGIL